MILEYCIAAIAIFFLGYLIGRSDEKKKREEIAVDLVVSTRKGMIAMQCEELEEVLAVMDGSELFKAHIDAFPAGEAS